MICEYSNTFDKIAPSPLNKCFKGRFKSFLIHFSVLSILDDIKHIVVVFLFDWYHKMVSPQNDDPKWAAPLATSLLPPPSARS